MCVCVALVLFGIVWCNLEWVWCWWYWFLLLYDITDDEAVVRIPVQLISILLCQTLLLMGSCTVLPRSPQVHVSRSPCLLIASPCTTSRPLPLPSLNYLWYALISTCSHSPLLYNPACKTRAFQKPTDCSACNTAGHSLCIDNIATFYPPAITSPVSVLGCFVAEWLMCRSSELDNASSSPQQLLIFYLSLFYFWKEEGS